MSIRPACALALKPLSLTAPGSASATLNFCAVAVPAPMTRPAAMENASKLSTLNTRDLLLIGQPSRQFSYFAFAAKV